RPRRSRSPLIPPRIPWISPRISECLERISSMASWICWRLWKHANTLMKAATASPRSKVSSAMPGLPSDGGAVCGLSLSSTHGARRRAQASLAGTALAGTDAHCLRLDHHPRRDVPELDAELPSLEAARERPQLGVHGCGGDGGAPAVGPPARDRSHRPEPVRPPGARRPALRLVVIRGSGCPARSGGRRRDRRSPG